MEELKPCPFCGGEADLTNCKLNGKELDNAWWCGCHDCHISRLGSSSEEASKKWNTRHERTCKWEIKKSGTLYDVYQCSACGYEYAESRTDKGIKVDLCDAKFCPNCGAKVVNDD